jgi:DNA primase
VSPILRQGLRKFPDRQERERIRAEIRRSLDAETVLRDVIGARNVSETGEQLVMSCPLPFGMHRNGDSNPSARLHRPTLLFVCYVCGGGDIFWLVSNVLDISIEDAIEMLSGVLVPHELSQAEFLAELESMWADKGDVAFALPSYSTQILKPWLRFCSYLENRGVGAATQEEMRTGVDLTNRDLFEKGEVKQWLTQPRLVLPLFFKGALRGWQKRKLDDANQWGPKYRSSPGFPRAYTLYGYDLVEQDDEVIVVESPMSVLRLRAQGIRNVVATLGAQITSDQLRLMHRFDHVKVFLDADPAGRHAAELVVEGLSAFTNVWVVPNEREGTDPADLTTEELHEALARAEPGVTWNLT